MTRVGSGQWAVGSWQGREVLSAEEESGQWAIGSQQLAEPRQHFKLPPLPPSLGRFLPVRRIVVIWRAKVYYN